MWASFERFELKMTMAQAQAMSHQGQCDADVARGRKIPAIARQLAKIADDKLVAELNEYGAWEDSELQDREANLDRILWIAAGNIVEEARQ